MPNHMIKKALIIFLISLIIFQSAAYSLETLNLEPLINEARQNNPEILSAKKRYEAMKARIPQAKSLDDPVIGFTFEKTPGSPFRLGSTKPEDRMLSITQAFPFFGKLSLKGKIALVESQMYASELKNKELEVINALKNAYYELFINYKEIELNEQSLALLENIAGIAQARYSTGELSQEEVFKIQLEIARLNTTIINLRQEKLSKQTRINTLLNRDAESALGAPVLNEDTSFNKDIDSLYRLTLENQPELLIFSYAIEKNKYAKDLAKKSFFPDFMSGIVMRGITSGSIGPWDLMLAFTVPLWFWTKQRYEVKEAIANLEQAQAAFQAMKNKAIAETKDLATQVKTSQNKIALLKHNVIPILESSIASSLAGLRTANTEAMLLIDNIRMLIETKLDYYKELVEYNINLANLERTVGLDLKKVKK